MTAVAYCRISKDKEGAGLGVERQAADCRELATKLGLGEPDVLSDNDLSAYSGKRRPGYEQLLAGLREGRWTTLLVWHVDRLCRSVRDLEDIVDLVNGSVSVHTVKGGEIDLETPEGRMQARMLGTLARYESEHRSDRVKRALQQNADKGKRHGGPRPYGWTTITGEPWNADTIKKDGAIVLEPAEAAIVAEMTRRIISGESTRGLAAELRARGVPSSKGAPWSAEALRGIILRARNAGMRELRGNLTKGDWPPIVDRDSWEAAKAVLEDPLRKTSPGNRPTMLLSGIAVCGGCGRQIHSGGMRRGVPIYRCAAGDIVRRAPEIDEVVEAVVLGFLEREQFTMSTPAEPASDRARADAVRVKLERLEDKYADEDMSRAAYLRNRDRLTAQLLELERGAILQRVPGPLTDVTPETWSTLSLERRRAVVEFLVDVKLAPVTTPGRHYPSPELVEVTTKRHGEE